MLFGPTLIYDLRRSARRGKFVLLRCLYAAILLVILGTVYAQFSDRMNNMLAALAAMSSGRVPPPRAQQWGPRLAQWSAALPAQPGSSQAQRLRAIQSAEWARFAETFFSIFMCIQLAAVVLLTPAYTAGVLADEKDRKTLEFLLATDLRDHEIVLSKWAVCLANLSLLILTGLPILSLIQLVGGVDPNLMLAGYAATALSMLSLASISMLVSVYSAKARDAIVLSYLALLAFLMVSFLLMALLPYLARPGASAGQQFCARILNAITIGNPVVLLLRLSDGWNAGLPLVSIVPGLLQRYAVFHGVLAVVTLAWAVLRMRSVALSPRRVKPVSNDRNVRHWLRPSIGRQPMLWKEVYAEPGMAFGWLGKIIVAAIIVVSFAPPLWYLGAITWQFAARRPFRSGLGWWDQMAQDVNLWVRVVGTTVATLTLLGVAVRAAGSITGERDRQTLDSLLTSPLESPTIVFAKWWGSVLSVRWAWIWLGFVWGVGAAAGGLDAVTLPWLLLIWLVYAAVFALLGLCASISCATTLRATLVTLVILAILSIATWPPRLSYPTQSSFVYGIELGMTPLVALHWFAFRGDDLFRGRSWETADPWGMFGGIVLGLGFWGWIAFILWRSSNDTFVAVMRQKGSG